MTSFLAIVKLTCRSAIRSNIFRSLLAVLLLCVLLIPNTIKGDGTATGFIQLILEYSLGFVTVILMISAAWTACSEIATDVESGQIHMIVVKPVPRIVVLLGKFTGVVAIHTALLLLSAAVVYGFVLYQFKKQSFPQDEKQRVEQEVLTGRRLYKPKKPDLDQMAVNEIERRVELAKQHGERISDKLDGDSRRATLESMKKELAGKLGEVAPGDAIFWDYEGLPETYTNPFFIRYKVFPADSTSLNQNATYGAWILRLMIPKNEESTPAGQDVEYVEQAYPLPPEELLTASGNEFGVQETVARVNGAPPQVFRNLSPEQIESLTKPLLHDGTFRIGFVNFAQDGKPLKFQESDGPFLLVRETGFLSNYCRTVVVSFLGIAAVALIASALAAFFTLPVAIFMTASYGMLCFFSSYMLATLKDMEGYPLEMQEKIGKVISQALIYVLIPMQDFFVTPLLATGQMIEFSAIGSLILYNLILRGLPLFLLGAWLYHSRELGIAVKR